MLINLTAKVAKGLRKGRNKKLCELNKANCNREKKKYFALFAVKLTTNKKSAKFSTHSFANLIKAITNTTKKILSVLCGKITPRLCIFQIVFFNSSV